MQRLLLITTSALIIGAAVHFSTFIGIDPLALCPPLIALHIVVIAVWIPTLMPLRELDYQRLFVGAPGWMVGLALLSFTYTIFSFSELTAFLESGVATELDGGRVLMRRGEVVGSLTDEQWADQQRLETRFYTAHWLMLCAGAMAVQTARLARRQRASVS